jgi:hypothetical protein
MISFRIKILWMSKSSLGEHFILQALLLREQRPELTSTNFEPMVADGITFWVDFVFIDQSARDIQRELDVLPTLLNGAKAHFVVGQRPLTRSWCCYEIALFNQDCAVVGAAQTPVLNVIAPSTKLHSFIAPTTKIYFDWEYTETTEAEDKHFIEEHIKSNFPNGFEGFNHIMQEANLTAVLSATESNPVYPPAGLSSLAKAAENWFERASQ